MILYRDGYSRHNREVGSVNLTLKPLPNLQSNNAIPMAATAVIGIIGKGSAGEYHNAGTRANSLLGVSEKKAIHLGRKTHGILIFTTPTNAKWLKLSRSN